MDPKHAVDLSVHIAQLRERARLQHKGHVAETIVKEHDLRAVLVVMPTSGILHPHQPEESVVLQVLDGLVRVHLSGETVSAAAGTILALGKGTLHDVEAVGDSVLLLVLPWPTQTEDAPVPKERIAVEGKVDETVRQSIPASDPPAWTTTHAGAPNREIGYPRKG